MGCAGVRICVFNSISGVRVRSRVGGQICSNCWIAGVRICVLNSVSACACVRGSADRLVSLFAVLYQVRLIAGDRVLRFSDTGWTNSSSCVVIRCMVYMGFGFLRANFNFCSLFDLFLFLFPG